MKTQSLLWVLFFLLILTPLNGFNATLSNIQSGTLTLNAGSGSVTQAITSVDLTKSFLVYSITTDSDRPGQSQIGGRMTSSTLLTFDRFDVSGAPAVTIFWQVFEFSAGVSVQRGVATNVPNAGTNVTISSISTASSFATVNMRKDGGQYGSDDFVTADITTSTNLYIDRDNGGANPQNVYWQVIEWTGATVQKITGTLTGGTDSLAVTLATTVDRDKTMILGAHRSSGNVDAGDLPCIELVNDNTVSFSRVGTTRNLAFVYYVVEFSDNTDVVHGSIRMTATQDDITTTICTVNTTDAGIIAPSHNFQTGANCETSDDEVGIAFANITISSINTVNAKRASTGFAAVFPFQVLEFTAASPSGCGPTLPGATTPRTAILCGVDLPIELVNFSAEVYKDKNVLVSWNTASEINNDYFEIERSRDGINFNVISNQKGAGNSSSLLSYEDLDENPYPGISYYRLKQVDFDGAYAYSEIVAVSLHNKQAFYVYPNPANDIIFIQSNGTIDPAAVQLFNTLGEQIPFELNQMEGKFSINLNNFPKGIYYLKYGENSSKIIKL